MQALLTRSLNVLPVDQHAPADGELSVTLTPDCVTKFNELKLGKEIKYIIYKLSDDNKEIVVEETSNEPDWDVFRQKLVDAKSKDKRGNLGAGPRYAVYDFDYELASGEGKRSAPSVGIGIRNVN